VGHVEREGQKRNEYSVLVGKREGRRLLGRQNHRRKENSDMDLKEI
jgi:hypothetical protein